MTTDEAPPAWLVRAVAVKPQHADLRVAGARIQDGTWGDPELPSVVLVHGGAAHSGWWDHIADGGRVVALDLSGHGDSEHRLKYDMRLWAEEVAAVTAAEGLRRPVIIGHSMGGWAAVTSCVDNPHPMLDQPLVFVAALRTLLTLWR